jgi:hypothetical protein
VFLSFTGCGGSGTTPKVTQQVQGQQVPKELPPPKIGGGGDGQKGKTAGGAVE